MKTLLTVSLTLVLILGSCINTPKPIAIIEKWEVIGKNNNFGNKETHIYFLKDKANPHVWLDETDKRIISFKNRLENGSWQVDRKSFDYSKIINIAGIRAVVSENGIPSILYVTKSGNVCIIKLNNQNNWVKVLDTLAITDGAKSLELFKCDDKNNLYAGVYVNSIASQEFTFISYKNKVFNIIKTPAPACDNYFARTFADISKKGLIYYTTWVKDYVEIYFYNGMAWQLVGKEGDDRLHMARFQSFAFDDSDNLFISYFGIGNPQGQNVRGYWVMKLVNNNWIYLNHRSFGDLSCVNDEVNKSNLIVIKNIPYISIIEENLNDSFKTRELTVLSVKGYVLSTIGEPKFSNLKIPIGSNGVGLRVKTSLITDQLNGIYVGCSYTPARLSKPQSFIFKY